LGGDHFSFFFGLRKAAGQKKKQRSKSKKKRDTSLGVGIKALNFSDFRTVAEIMEMKGHLTSSPPISDKRWGEGAEGLEKIKTIKAGMNKGRF